jgi:hypothetical protein
MPYHYYGKISDTVYGRVFAVISLSKPLSAHIDAFDAAGTL